jgi:hypothetical protein
MNISWHDYVILDQRVQYVAVYHNLDVERRSLKLAAQKRVYVRKKYEF